MAKAPHKAAKAAKKTAKKAANKSAKKAVKKAARKTAKKTPGSKDAVDKVYKMGELSQAVQDEIEGHLKVVRETLHKHEIKTLLLSDSETLKDS